MSWDPQLVGLGVEVEAPVIARLIVFAINSSSHRV